MGTIVQQPPGALPVVAARQISGVALPRQISGRRVACLNGPGRCVCRRAAARQISGRRVACLNGPGRCVCRRAAARPRDRHTRASLGVVDLEARPGPAAALRHRGQALQAPRRPPIGRACVLAMALPPHSAWGYAESVGASG